MGLEPLDRAVVEVHAVNLVAAFREQALAEKVADEAVDAEDQDARLARLAEPAVGRGLEA